MTINVEHLLDRISQKTYELDAYRDHLIKESVCCLRNMADGLMKSALQAQPNVVSRLGVDGLKHLKEEFKTIMASLGTQAHQVLESDELWVYKQKVALSTLDKLDSNGFPMVKQTLPQPLLDALESLLSPFGALLNTYNLAPKEDWQIVHSCYQYQGTIPLTPTLLESAKEFSMRHQEYDQLIDELIDSQKGKEQSSVLDLWDSL
ncbi:hypothetical protein M9194_18940 [Vibrio sp. S4M6]|uniref:hypothetical protein n=1 Tax=Vibrio sinus TaxID=2946865 RepID=UPI00202A5BE0|nr:hypothetical protein [Vibrio sinus]MCL9783507.1 hypothetical protein [Vibrio sinus]